MLWSETEHAPRLLSIAAAVGESTERSDVLSLLREARRLLGAERSIFMVFRRDGPLAPEHRLMLDCDPAWGLRYLSDLCAPDDPWMAYAAEHSEPILAGSLDVPDDAAQQVIGLGAKHGFVSTLLVPAHAGAANPCVGLLCLGSSTAGHFENRPITQHKVLGRLLAQELFEWWLAALRRELSSSVSLGTRELQLLRYAALGYSSKKIAREEGVTNSAINSRFQRLVAKLGVTNRKMAARLARQHGLIQG